MISADFLIYIGVFYVYFSFQKYLTCQDWIKKSLLSRFHNCVVLVLRIKLCMQKLLQYLALGGKIYTFVQNSGINGKSY